MRVGREDAAAGWVGRESMVSGGTDGEIGGWLASTELLVDGEWEAGVHRPAAVQAHCMVQLNTSQVFYSGGWETGGNVKKV